MRIVPIQLLKARRPKRCIVKRHPNSPGADFLNDEDYLDVPYGNSGLKTTARDIAVFAQTFLNRGCYGDTRILSRGTVGEMTRNQLAGIRGGASYGLGFFVIENFRMPGLNGSLLPRGTFTHLGAGGVNFWVDPVNEIVGAYFGVQPPTDSKDYGTTAQSVLQHPDRGDMFQNMVTAAVAD